MVAPLLGLLGLAGGALGQDWYFNREAREVQEKLKGILGRAPEQLAPGVAGPPAPGTGLMGDPGNIHRQMELAAGVMGFNPRQQAQARALLEPILGRASQADLTREGWGFQAGENRLSREQAQSQFEARHTQIGEHFERGHGLLQEQFAFTKEKHGEEQAWREFTWGKEHLLRQASEARAREDQNYDRVLKELEIEKRRRDLAGGGAEVKLPTGYRGVMLPTGAPSDAPLPAGVMGPVRTDPGEVRAVPIMGTPDWVKGQGDVDVTTGARVAVQSYLEHVRKHGFVKTGDQAGVQKNLYTRTQDAVRTLRQSGTMNIGEMPLIKEELPDPTEVLRSPVSQSFVLGHLGSLQESLGGREQQLRNRYRGWNLTFSEIAPSARGGQSAPPAGSVPVGGGGYGGRGSGR